MKKSKPISTREYVLMQVGIDPGATCTMIYKALDKLYYPRRFDPIAVSSILNRLSKQGVLVRVQDTMSRRKPWHYTVYKTPIADEEK